jgi:asparagine synthase (glutamine-hydrolysing)
MYLSHGLTEMLALGFLTQAPFRLLLRGHCGELAKTRLAWPLHTDDTVESLGTTGLFLDHLLRRFREVWGHMEWLHLFTRRWRTQMTGAARASLEEVLLDVALPPLELCSYLYLREHHRRFTVPSLELLRHAVEVRLPFADEEFLEALLGGDPRWRESTDLHRAIIRTYDPWLLRVRDSNTGAPVDAGPVRALFSDKANSVFRRLNVWGYRHYHDFGAWMERSLAASVRSVLLAPRSLDRGILVREHVCKLLESVERGQRRYAYLLQVLLILELWQQEVLDQPCTDPGPTGGQPRPILGEAPRSRQLS